MKRPELSDFNDSNYITILEKCNKALEKYIDQLEQELKEECDAHARTLKKLEEK